jgi:hypothetical protein
MVLEIAMFEIAMIGIGAAILMKINVSTSPCRLGFSK